jgi:L-ascorbate metabolism protein UlaG (beta-lactamase superfamily)
MKIHHLRNATMILEFAGHRLLVDPMLADPGTLPGFKMVGGGRRRNPLVPLPDGTEQALDTVTAVLVTHEHPDHFDPRALQWVRDRELPLWTSAVDAPSLRSKGLVVEELRDGLGGLSVEVVPVSHGRGFIGWMMGPVSGVFLDHPDEPSVLLTSDSVLDDRLLGAVIRLRPQVILAPAGAANFGIGPSILFSEDELTTLVRRAPGTVVLNHLEALDHCPTTRDGLRSRLEREGLLEKVWIPEDGEAREFAGDADDVGPRDLIADDRRPGFQKRLTVRFSGT